MTEPATVKHLDRAAEIAVEHKIFPNTKYARVSTREYAMRVFFEVARQAGEWDATVAMTATRLASECKVGQVEVLSWLGPIGDIYWAVYEGDWGRLLGDSTGLTHCYGEACKHARANATGRSAPRRKVDEGLVTVSFSLSSGMVEEITRRAQESSAKNRSAWLEDYLQAAFDADDDM